MCSLITWKDNSQCGAYLDLSAHRSAEQEVAYVREELYDRHTLGMAHLCMNANLCNKGLL